MPNAPKATVDFETRSACSIKNCGAWRYSVDPSTEVLCLAFRLPHWPEGETALWHPAFPLLDIPEDCEWDRLAELLDWVQSGGLLEAHNAFFERSIWMNVLVPQHGFPPVRHEQWRDSATKAAAHALQRGLDDVNRALQLKVLKDEDGHKVMLKVSKPRKPRKAEREFWALIGEPGPMPELWHESADLFDRLWAYCRQDVLAEEALSASLSDLNPRETHVYLLDQKINQRGFLLDSEAVSAALRLIDTETTLLNEQLAKLTGGEVQKATQRDKMLHWFAANGLYLDNTQKGTLDDLLLPDDLTGQDLKPVVREAIALMRELGRSSTAKYEAMDYWMDPADSRVRGGLLYHGASTGRWSGAGVQPHNFPKGKVKDQDALWTLLKRGERDAIIHGFKTVLTALSEGLRGAIIPSLGHDLVVADYASIEARVLLWAADDDDALDIFRSGRDIYCEMAAEIYNRVITKADKDERQLGKAAVLGCGYQMGGSKFVATAAMYGVTIDEEFATEVVNAYRTKFWRVKQMWWDMEAAAIQALSSRKAIRCGHVLWEVQGRFLYCTLPSGRRIAYPEPRVIDRETPWGAKKPALTFMGINTYTRQWQRQTTYGGSLVENIVQAIARDLMAEAMLRIEATGLYKVVLTVHDEVVAECPEGRGDVKQFEQLMATCPDWAQGCPVEAEGWMGKRYRK